MYKESFIRHAHACKIALHAAGSISNKTHNAPFEIHTCMCEDRKM